MVSPYRECTNRYIATVRAGLEAAQHDPGMMSFQRIMALEWTQRQTASMYAATVLGLGTAVFFWAKHTWRTCETRVAKVPAISPIGTSASPPLRTSCYRGFVAGLLNVQEER